MTKEKSAVAELDTLLGGIEAVLLASSDRQIATDMSGDAQRSKQVAKLVQERLRLRSGADISSRHRSQLQPGNAPLVPAELAHRIRLLRALAMARPAVPPQVRSVFSGGRRPSKNEVDRIVEELVRLGLLRKRK